MVVSESMDTIEGRTTVYRQTGGSWNVEQELLSTPNSLNFGRRVATDGERVAVLSDRVVSLGANQFVHVFEQISPAAWQVVSAIPVDNARSIAIEGDLIVAGGLDLTIHEFNGTEWQQTHNVNSLNAVDLDLSGDRILAVGQFAMRLLDRQASGTWTTTEIFNTPEGSTFSETLLRSKTVALTADSIWYGKPKSKTMGQEAGAAYAYDLNASPCTALAIINLACTDSPQAVTLSWDTLGSVDTIEVRRDGVLVATLPGDSLAYEDPFVGDPVTRFYTLRALTAGNACCSRGCLNDPMLRIYVDLSIIPGGDGSLAFPYSTLLSGAFKHFSACRLHH